MKDLAIYITKYWVEFLLATLSAIMLAWIKGVRANSKQKKDEDEHVKQAVKILLRKELERECNKYLELGYIPVEESEDALDTVNELWEPYDGLHGNSTGESKHKQFIELPIRRSDKEVEL